MKNLLLIALIGFQTLLYGQYSGGDGTSGNPYQIATPANLITLSKTSGDWGKYFIQTVNIDFGENEQAVDWDGDGTATWDTEDQKGFRPIGLSPYFTGSYNGNGHTVSNLYINRSDSFIGLFGVVQSGGKIENLGVVACNITGGVTSTTGGLAGQNNNGSSTITNCYSTGNVTGVNSVGGLVGYNNSLIPITNCYSTCNVSGTHNIGGLVGYNGFATVSNSYSTGIVSGTGTWVGGLVGNSNNSSLITNCYSTGNVSGANNVGGLVGANDNSSTVNNCYSFSDVTRVTGTSSSIGGFCGYNFNSTITYSYSIGDVIYAGVPNPTDKGFVGNTNIAHTTNFFDSEESNQTTATGATPKTTAEMKSASTFAGWDFTTIWDIDGSTNSGYPFLVGNAPVPFTAIWDGSESTAWNTAANWDGNVVPTSGDNVIIPGGGNPPIISSGTGANCNYLTINTGATLTVESGGSLITNGSITNNGTIEIKRDISQSAWHLTSIPVTTSTANSFLGDYLQSWSEASHVWTDITDPATTLQPLQGYGLWATPSKAAASYTFTGTPNTGNMSKSLSFTEYSTNSSAYEGANLLGNPYPSAIDWSLLDNTYGAVNYWNSATGSYSSWNDGAAVNGSVQYIPPMQGFFIIAQANGTFSINNTHRTHTGATSYFKNDETPENSIRLVASSQNYSDEMLVRFTDEATSDFDLQHDAYKFPSGTAGLSELCSYAGDKKLSIDARPECEVVQLGFSNSESGTYSIGINQANGISKATLEDTKTNTFTDLLKGSFSFTWLAGEDDKRFKLHMGTVGFEETPVSEIAIYSHHKTAYINLRDQLKGDIYIYNMTGQLITSRETAIGLVSVGINTPGIYIVKVVSEKKTTTAKIFIQ